MCSIDYTYEQFGNAIHFRADLNLNSYKMMLIVILMRVSLVERLLEYSFPK